MTAWHQARVAAGLLGVIVLQMEATRSSLAARPVLTLVFFAAGPGLSVVPLVGVRDVVLAAALVVAVSAAATIGLAQSMLWLGHWSPTVAVAIVLAALLASTAVPFRRTS